MRDKIANEIKEILLGTCPIGIDQEFINETSNAIADLILASIPEKEFSNRTEDYMVGFSNATDRLLKNLAGEK